MKETITVQFDGGSRGNPGPAGVGVVLRAEDDTPLVTLGRFIGRATNNVAEYRALILGLEQALALGATKVQVRGDSELIIKQMRGEYRVKNPELRELYETAQDLLSQFEIAKIDHNYRHNNALADKLANLAMDRRADVADADDVEPATQPKPAAAATRGSMARRTAAASVATPPSAEVVTATAGDVYACPRCGCVIAVEQPSDRPAQDQGSFQCVCGVRMKRRI